MESNSFNLLLSLAYSRSNQQLCEKTMNFLTPTEILAVLKAAKEKSTRDWLMFLMAYRHGLRASEITALTVDDLKAGTLHIARLKGSRTTLQPITAHQGQPLMNEAKGLKQWLSERPSDLGNALFPSAKGGHLQRQQVFRLFRKYAQLAGLTEDKCHPHILKHSTVSHLVRAGMDIASVAQRVGHANLSSTMKYTHLDDSEVSEKAHDILMDLF